MPKKEEEESDDEELIKLADAGDDDDGRPAQPLSSSSSEEESSSGSEEESDSDEGEGGDEDDRRRDASAKKPQRKKTRASKHIIVNLELCRYRVVRQATRNMGWKRWREGEEWDVMWSEGYIPLEMMMQIRKFQRVNHFPGMSEITNKANLARNLNRMKRAFPEEYNFHPKTWILPSDVPDFKGAVEDGKKKKYFILKPATLSRGRGIYLIRSIKQLKQLSPDESFVAQEYLANPLLIDGYKFDLRIYVLVLSVAPLRLFVYKNGLARLATEPYQEPSSKNMRKVYMHLTNYAVNKHNDRFQFNTDAHQDGVGSKRSLHWVLDWIDKQGRDSKQVFSDICDVVVKTIAAVQPSLGHSYKATIQGDAESINCFEFLGFDVILDKEFRPWIVEVNCSPNLDIDTPLDQEIKESCLTEAFRLLNVSVKRRKKIRAMEREKLQRLRAAAGSKRSAEERKAAAAAERDAQAERLVEVEAQRTRFEDKNLGEWARVYPAPGAAERYEKLLGASSNLLRETAASLERRRLAEQRAKEAADGSGSGGAGAGPLQAAGDGVGNKPAWGAGAGGGGPVRSTLGKDSPYAQPQGAAAGAGAPKPKTKARGPPQNLVKRAQLREQTYLKQKNGPLEEEEEEEANLTRRVLRSR